MNRGDLKRGQPVQSGQDGWDPFGQHGLACTRRPHEREVMTTGRTDLGGTAGGWTVSADGSHVDLTGGLCDGAKAGRFASLLDADISDFATEAEELLDLRFRSLGGDILDVNSIWRHVRGGLMYEV
jgi:hypothetical protein